MDVVTEACEYELVAAGFWRRIAAFIVDVLILWIFGAFIGWGLYYSLIGLGSWSLCIGFVVAMAYFATQDSHLGKGRTLGKRLLHVCVVDTTGRFLSVPHATLRYVVFSLPYFFCRWPVPPSLRASMLWPSLASLVIVGLSLSIAYLYVFNYRTRQSLHDLVAGSYVIDTDPYVNAVPFAPIWRGHLMAVAVLIALTLSTPLVLHRQILSPELAAIMPLYGTLQTEPHVTSASVNLNQVSVNGEAPVQYLSARLRLDNPMIADPAFAYRVARFMANRDPNIAKVDVMTVTLYCGFDLGIASWWINETYSYRPNDFNKLLH
jgi:uncharacterized RDD family membrane protein YckC